MTTIVLVRKNNDVVVASDGQVSMGNTVIKKTAKKASKLNVNFNFIILAIVSTDISLRIKNYS